MDVSLGSSFEPDLNFQPPRLSSASSIRRRHYIPELAALGRSNLSDRQSSERPSVCLVCGKVFARQHDLERHERIHAEEHKSGTQWEALPESSDDELAKDDSIADESADTINAWNFGDPKKANAGFNFSSNRATEEKKKESSEKDGSSSAYDLRRVERTERVSKERSASLGGPRKFRRSPRFNALSHGWLMAQDADKREYCYSAGGEASWQRLINRATQAPTPSEAKTHSHQQKLEGIVREITNADDEYSRKRKSASKMRSPGSSHEITAFELTQEELVTKKACDVEREPAFSDSGYHAGKGTDAEPVCSLDSSGSSLGLPQDFLQDFVTAFANSLIEKSGAKAWAAYTAAHSSPEVLEKCLHDLLRDYAIGLSG